MSVVPYPNLSGLSTMNKPTRQEIQKVLAEGRKAKTWTEYWEIIDEAVKLTELVSDVDPELLAEQFDEALGHKLCDSYQSRT